jgi:hypothetical protein
MAKDAYYFSHDSNARNDDKILKLRSKFGYEGYGLFWALIEVLRESTNYKFEVNNIKLLQLSLAHPTKKLQSFIEFCINVGLLAKDNQFFWSERLLKSMISYNEKRTILSDAGKKGNEKRWKGDKGSESGSESGSNRIKVKEIKEIKESKVKGNEKIILLFNFLDFDENKLNDSIILRTQILIDKFTYPVVQDTFVKVSELDNNKKNIAYIEAILNSPKSTPKQSPDIQFSYMRELD